MARPKKENAEYFSHDSGMRNDPKIKALRRRFSIGYSVYNMFLEYLTDCSFFEFEMNDLQYEILAGDFDVETETLIQILDYCVKIGLLERQNNVFFSNGLKKRLQTVLDKRNNSKNKFLNQKPTEKAKEVHESVVSVTETTQSKVKESKVKESIVLLKKEPKEAIIEVVKIQYPFFTENFKTQWQLWKVYKSKEFNFKYKSIESEQAALTELSNLSQKSEKKAIEIINQSMAKGWKGFFELKNNTQNGKQFNNSGPSTNTGYKPATVDRERLIQELTYDAANGNIPGQYQ
jgi:hypothetical protein